MTKTNKTRPLSEVGEALPAACTGGVEDGQEAGLTAAHLYKIAEAAQAAVDLLRSKLATAEAEIERLHRERAAFAAELYSESRVVRSRNR